MEITSKPVLVVFFLLVLVIGFTLYNIYDFMPVNEKCKPSFEVINKCGCIPDEGLAKILNYKGVVLQNISIKGEFSNG